MSAVMQRLRAMLPGWPLSRLLFVLGLLGAVGATYWSTHPVQATAQVPQLLLVLPDGSAGDPVQIQAWLDAAQELGYALETVSDSQLLRRARAPQGSALILPDTLHRRMSDALITALRDRVRAGDSLMLVHDAGIADVNGHYREDRSRLSDLAGVDYGLYGELRTGMLREAEAWVLPEQIGPLQIPPGKLVRGSEDRPHTRALPAPEPEETLAVAGYIYGRLRYTSFVTRGHYDGTRLMTTADGSLVAGRRVVGAGQVLFVNLPLTLLKVRTDSLPLHTFLRYYADQVAAVAQFSPVPDGIGAVVMNWHVDDRKALPALQRAAEMGAFKQGPYSIHFTAGPDVNTVGDGKGMDLAGNPEAQEWVRQLARNGHEIGSHGGWIHNWFGERADKLDREVAAALIERNSAVISQLIGRPVREYSAPVGTHPSWVTAWLRRREVRSYYFTGDTGMAPTRSYQDGQRPLPDIWTYPVLNFGHHASFEEAKWDNTPEADVAAWLADIDDFCADHRTIRLVYFHPVGLVMYPQAFRQWLEHARTLTDRGRMRWTTMAAYSDFSNRRLRVRWSIGEPRDATRGTTQQLEAHHPQSLEGMTWLLPRRRYGLPTVISGQARVDQDGDVWRIVAGAGTGLRVHLPVDHPGGLAAAASSP
jgi:hypothetical protein